MSMRCYCCQIHTSFLTQSYCLLFSFTLPDIVFSLENDARLNQVQIQRGCSGTFSPILSNYSARAAAQEVFKFLNQVRITHLSLHVQWHLLSPLFPFSLLLCLLLLLSPLSLATLGLRKLQSFSCPAPAGLYMAPSLPWDSSSRGSKQILPCCQSCSLSAQSKHWDGEPTHHHHCHCPQLSPSCPILAV